MIVSIHHKGLRLLWEKNDSSKLPAQQVNKIRKILTLLDAAAKVDDMKYPGSGFHELRGNLSGFYAVTVTGKLAHYLSFRERRCLFTKLFRLSLGN